MSARIDLLLLLPFALVPGARNVLAPISAPAPPPESFGYTDFAHELNLEDRFMAVPDAKLAGEHMKLLSAEPHIAGSPEDRKTAEYVARKFRAAGLETEIVPYRVLLDEPVAERVEAWNDKGRLLMSGPAREHIASDPAQDDPRVVMPFSSGSASGEVSGEVVYANYGNPEDFDHLAAEHVDLRGKILLCRYGANFRGVKALQAEQHGAAGVLLYSDPDDDGAGRGEVWPYGPWRPETSVQRGAVQYLFRAPGDPETPGFASTPTLPDTARSTHYTGPGGSQPGIVVLPLSAHDAAPILAALTGPIAPEDWQGGLVTRYRLGGGVHVHLLSRQSYRRRIIWNVLGRVRGSEAPDEWIVAGNHRDAWVYGASDPVSGTAAMLEAVHGIGALLRQGWRPRRSLLFCSWDAEEQGLIGSTEWVEDHPDLDAHAVAYFNMDVAVSGSDFSASATPSLKEFLRSIARRVPSPQGGTVYQQWRTAQAGAVPHPPRDEPEVRIAALGSGSDYTPFFEHAGIPSSDISSDGAYGVYHSVFDNYAWYTQNADPHFAYLRQMAQFFGLEVLRMDGAAVLPYDDAAYAHEILTALDASRRRAGDAELDTLDFARARASASRFLAAASALRAVQFSPPRDPAQCRKIDLALRQAESALLSPSGLPGRPWYRHLIFAPGETTGYAALVLPGVNEAIAARDPQRAAAQLDQLDLSLAHAARLIEEAR
jgi:N-acetylated-alpha-linked acidic dipeptidase